MDILYTEFSSDVINQMKKKLTHKGKKAKSPDGRDNEQKDVVTNWLFICEGSLEGGVCQGTIMKRSELQY